MKTIRFVICIGITFLSLWNTGCKRENPGVEGTAQVQVYEDSATGSAASLATVSLSHTLEEAHDERFFTEMTADSHGRVTFTLEPGTYYCVASIGKSLTNDFSKVQDSLHSHANGPIPFTIKTGSRVNLTAILDYKTDSGKGHAHIFPRLFSENGPIIEKGLVSVYGTLEDALKGTGVYIKQFISSTGSVITWDPGTYYVVADYTDKNGVEYTSDTTKVKGYKAGPPPSSAANGPHLIELKEKQTSHATIIVDYRE